MIADRIDTLRSYLLRLPKSLPVARDTSRYNFDQFSPDVDFIQENGEEAATNRELEVILGSRATGALVLPERGPGVVELANVLEKFIQNFPHSALPLLWLTDVTKAAEATILAAGVQVCHIIRVRLLLTC
jgi:hypothetical protein